MNVSNVSGNLLGLDNAATSISLLAALVAAFAAGIGAVLWGLSDLPAEVVARRPGHAPTASHFRKFRDLPSVGRS